jgi:molecular chaperone DnaJ
MSDKNYYEVLGVSEDATQDDIKKAYKKKAIEHHPDKGGNEEEFKKISEAYESIGTEDKRKQYDNSRRNPFGGGGGFNPFEEFFNRGFGNPFANRAKVVPDKIIDISIGAIESYKASDKKITYSRKVECTSCSGTGGERITCSGCNGEGSKTIRIGTGMFVQMVRQTCNQCAGKGFNFKTKCGTCHGESTLPNIETFSIKIPHGVDEGQFFRVEGKGDFHQGVYGNLVIRVKISPEENFEKSGGDLIYNAYFDYDSLSKDELEIPHPDGPINVKLPDEFDTTKPLRIKSKGYNTNGIGDLYVKLFVKFRRGK